MRKETIDYVGYASRKEGKEGGEYTTYNRPLLVSVASKVLEIKI